MKKEAFISAVFIPAFLALCAGCGRNHPMEISNGRISAAFDPETGDWTTLRFMETDASNIIRIPGPAIDCVVDGNPVLGTGSRRVKSYRVSADRKSLDIEYKKDGIRVIHHAELDAREPVLSQSVRIEATTGGKRKLTEVWFVLPSPVIGQSRECRVQAPGQVLTPDSPYPECASKPLDASVRGPDPSYPQGWLESAPDQTSGLIAVENPVAGRILSAWLYSEIATVFPVIDGKGETLDIGHHLQLAAWLKPGESVTAAGHSVLLTRGLWADHLARFRDRAYGNNLVSFPDTPGWLKNARLLQIDPRPVADWEKRIEWIRDLGFDVVYLMPVWKNQGNVYALLDHFALDQKTPAEAEKEQWASGKQKDPLANPWGVGTADDMKSFVNAAHREGLKVFFDLIPQGIGVRSPFIHEHPDWLVRDELGRPFASHGWGPGPGEPAETGTYSCDWGNPDYRKFAIDWALWNIRTFDIDGFRMDAMHWKEPNFDPSNPRPAWHTLFGGVRLFEELRDAVRAVKKDFILLSEVWGPIFQRAADGTYENGWLLKPLNEGWLKGRPLMKGADWAKALADAGDARPPGTVRAAFFANHDIQGMVEEARTNPMGDAVRFVHAFSGGIPFVWYRELEGKEPFYRDLMRLRQTLLGYSCSLRSAASDSKDVFTALWTRPGNPSYLVLANLSFRPVTARIRTDVPANEMEIVFGGNRSRLSVIPNGCAAEMPGAGYALVRLE
ncbi:hypothetical protein JW906_00340 [bacterium]|nr:hypothetical protein [bacterium]